MNLGDHWIKTFRGFLSALEEGDPAHDLQHIERVVLNTRALAETEGLPLEVLLPAAYLHDCVHIAKDSPERSQASRLAADRAIEFLREKNYPAEHFRAIHHAIEAHSFSAGISPRTIEAKVLQDADRIDALGAVGLSRCLMLGGHLGSQLYHRDDPFCQNRPAEDAKYCVDHFFAKLLSLKDTMQTEAGRQLAEERTNVLHSFLDQLKREIS
ncbi:MAG: HD domain-containing protein [Akkermansiaceae bacterium]